MAQPNTGLSNRNIALGQRHIVHAVQLDDQVSILSTEPEGSIAVTSRLGRNLDGQGFGAKDRLLDVLNGGWDGDGNREIRKTNVERSAIALPVGRTFSVDGDSR